MKHSIKILLIVLFSIGIMQAQDKTDTTKIHMKEHMKMMKNMPDSCKQMMKDMKDGKMPENCKKMLKKMKDNSSMSDSCKMMKNMKSGKMHKVGHDMSGEKGHKMMKEGHEMMMDKENYKKDKSGHETMMGKIPAKKIEMDQGMMGRMHGNKTGMHSKEGSIVRKGIIDVKSIDKNKDGFVFQDRMDWNVISDEEGSCPICEMKLVKVTVEQARENLIKNGFKVK